MMSAVKGFLVTVTEVAFKPNKEIVISQILVRPLQIACSYLVHRYSRYVFPVTQRD